MAETIEPNSRKYKSDISENAKPDRPKAKQIARKERREPLSKRVENSFISENVETVKDYLIWDVLIPAMKATVVDLGKKALDAIFYGDRPTGLDNIERKRSNSYVRYDMPSYDKRYPSRENRHARFDCRDYPVDSRMEGEEVMNYLVDCTMQDSVATVRDFKEACGYKSSYVDDRWGWYELSSMKTIPARGNKWIVSVPKPTMLD